jgi:CRP-like cAMP-binding protein
MSVQCISNHILGCLPPASKIGETHLDRVSLNPGMVLQEPNEAIRHVYFVNRGLVSLLSISSDGEAVEVGITGREGMVGLPAVLGGFCPYRAVVQIGGDAMRMDTERVTEEFQRNGSFHDLVLEYTNVVLVQMAQNSICNCYHTLQEKLSRWLLIARHVTLSDKIHVTHDVIARLLGTRRASVTVSAGLLQRAGLIRMSRGEINIIDYTGLEATACECYGVMIDGLRSLGRTQPQ